MNVTLCVLLWAREGREAALVAYEDQVLALLPAHGATVLQRARTDGSDGQPLEVHLLAFPSERALEEYMRDDRRTQLTADREEAIARTEILRVDLV